MFFEDGAVLAFFKGIIYDNYFIFNDLYNGAVFESSL